MVPVTILLRQTTRDPVQTTTIRNLTPVFLGLFMFFGCNAPAETQPTIRVWARRGIGDGRFHKPRAIAHDKKDNLYIVDMTGRIQVFDAEQNFVRSWRTPEIRMGKPCGLSVSNDGVLMVADTHYHRILFYQFDGTLLPERTLGGTQGLDEGEFGYVTDVVQDSRDNYYVSEYGEFDRIQKFSRAGEFVLQWGGRGSDDGQFLRPQGLAIDENDHLWVADASNHRIQVFDVSADQVRHLHTWGSAGIEPGCLSYPYDLTLHDQNVFVCEFGNHRVQRFSRQGDSWGTWGVPGREPGQFHQPWAMTIDNRHRMHVVDSYNHRIQTLNCDEIEWSDQTASINGD